MQDSSHYVMQLVPAGQNASCLNCVGHTCVCVCDIIIKCDLLYMLPHSVQHIDISAQSHGKGSFTIKVWEFIDTSILKTSWNNYYVGEGVYVSRRGEQQSAMSTTQLCSVCWF